MKNDKVSLLSEQRRLEIAMSLIKRRIEKDGGIKLQENFKELCNEMARQLEGNITGDELFEFYRPIIKEYCAKMLRE